MTRIQRFERESSFTTGAKAMSIIFMVGVIALLVARTTLQPGEDVTVSAEPAVRQLVGVGGTGATTLTQQEAEAAGRAAKQDDPPIATF